MILVVSVKEIGEFIVDKQPVNKIMESNAFYETDIELKWTGFKYVLIKNKNLLGYFHSLCD